MHVFLNLNSDYPHSKKIDLAVKAIGSFGDVMSDGNQNIYVI